MHNDEHELPEAIVNHQASGVLELRWHDGSADRLPHGLLRQRCRCAGCQAAFRLREALPSIDDALRLDALHPVADLGLNLVFSDGHGRGIFPWRYLHDIGRELRAATATSATSAAA